MFDASIQGKLKALWLMGEDVVQTDPNTQKVIKAMEQLDLLVVQELFMTETANYATVVLPGASFLEKAARIPMGKEEYRKSKSSRTTGRDKSGRTDHSGYHECDGF